jgi:hypothetical protein
MLAPPGGHVMRDCSVNKTMTDDPITLFKTYIVCDTHEFFAWRFYDSLDKSGSAGYDQLHVLCALYYLVESKTKIRIEKSATF